MKLLERTAFANAYANNVAHLSSDEVMTFLEEYYSKDYIDYSGDYTSLVDAIGMWRDARRWQGEKEIPLEKRLSQVCDLLFQINREAILRDGDWWYGTDNYDFNFFDWGGTPYHVNVTVYDITRKHFQYSEEQQVFSKEIFIGARI